jgi:hypothetical protein
VKPTDCTTLLTKHIGKHKSQTQLESMGEIAFLFRDASAKGEDKYKPICGAANMHLSGINCYWNWKTSSLSKVMTV